MTSGSSNRAALALVGDVCRRFSIASLAARVGDILAYASENEHVDVVVLGRFKSGKSSLLNALLGRDVLPIDVLPATAVVTRITGGIRDRARVVRDDGTETPVDVRDIRRYVTERENPGNVESVARVDVELRSPAVPAGLRLVDTPGVGSVHRHNTEAVERWLPRVGAALVAVSADQPLCEQDVVLLEGLRSVTPLVTIALTKADLVELDQLRSIEEYVGRETLARLGPAVAVMPVSVRPGREAWIARLRGFLVDSIAADRVRAADAILTHKVRSVVDAGREYLGVALEAARAGAQVREKLRGEIEDERRAIGLIDKELSQLCGHLREQAQSATERRFLARRAETTHDLRAELAREARSWRGNLAREATAYRRWLETALETRLSAIGAQEQGAWQGILEQAETGINRVVRAFKDRLGQRVRQAIGIPFAGVTFEARPRAPTEPSLHLGRVFDSQVDALWFVVPMIVFRPLVHRHFRSVVAWEVEKHLYRLSSQWTGAIAGAIEGTALAAREHVRAELETLADLLARSGDDAADIEDAMRSLAVLRPTVTAD